MEAPKSKWTKKELWKWAQDAHTELGKIRADVEDKEAALADLVKAESDLKDQVAKLIGTLSSHKSRSASLTLTPVGTISGKAPIAIGSTDVFDLHWIHPSKSTGEQYIDFRGPAAAQAARRLAPLRLKMREMSPEHWRLVANKNEANGITARTRRWLDSQGHTDTTIEVHAALSGRILLKDASEEKGVGVTKVGPLPTGAVDSSRVQLCLAHQDGKFLGWILRPV